jgi:hypothetical protein
MPFGMKRILSPEEIANEQKERAKKALELNGFTKPDYDPKYDPSIYKPTLRIKRLI